MKRKNLITMHVIATALAAICIFTFFTSSLVAETLQNHELIKNVKQLIVYLLPVLIIAMPTLAITGYKLGGQSKSPIIVKKKKRMKWMAINGITLIALAIYLNSKAQAHAFDTFFWMAQILEFMLGACNLTLIVLNTMLGFRLSGRFKKRIITDKTH